MPSKIDEVTRDGTTIYIRARDHMKCPINFRVDFENEAIQYKDGETFNGRWKNVETNEFWEVDLFMTKPKYPEAGSEITPEMLPWTISLRKSAEVLGIAYRTMQHYIEEGRIPVVNLGHRTKRIYYKDLETFVKNRRKIDELILPFYQYQEPED